jgi:hypothetical protein
MPEAGDDCALIQFSRNAVVIEGRVNDCLRGETNWLMPTNSFGGGEGVTLANQCENKS